MENSITYGLEKMLDVCRIVVSCAVDQEDLCIIVADNGPGIPPPVLQKIRQWEFTPNGLGIGLKNIDERFKLIYGGRYGVTIDSEPGLGTRVELRLPMAGGGDAQKSVGG